MRAYQRVLRSFNGLLYDVDLKESVAYIKKVVSHVCTSIPPDIKWDDSRVFGKSNICKVIIETVEEIGDSRQYKVVGLYGVGGNGKTTTCKILCNELSNEYDGRVCHIELPSVPWSDCKEFYQKVVRDLTRKSWDDIQHLDEGEWKNILRKILSEHGSFLVIDNISDLQESIALVEAMLELPYHRNSLVVVTARSQSIFELSGINVDACLEMLDLEEVDAMGLFLQHVASGRQFFQDGDKRHIMTCIKRCYFSKGGGEGRHYHPLALRSLGLQLRRFGANPSLWVKHLPRVKDFNTLSGTNLVFGILRSGFDLLSPRD